MTIYCGEDSAKSLGDEHEQEGLTKRRNSDEANMDLWNNNQGREIGQEITNELFSRYGYKINYFELYPTIKNIIAEKVMQRMRSGQLITSPNDKRRYVPKNKSGNPTGYAVPVSSSVKSFESNRTVTKSEKSQTPSQNFSDIIRQQYKSQVDKTNKKFNLNFRSHNHSVPTGRGHWATINGAHIFIED